MVFQPKQMFPLLVATAVLFSASSPVAASETARSEPNDIIYLVGGDILKGTFLSADDKTVYLEVLDGDKLKEESYPRDKVRRILRLLPSGATKQVFPPLPQDRPFTKRRPKKKEPEKAEPSKPEPRPVSPEIREEYEKRLKKLHQNHAKREFELGLWCEENGMDNEAALHFARALELDNANDEYKIKCGFKKINGTWVGPGNIDKAKKEQTKQRKINEAYEKSPYEKFMGIWVAPELNTFMESLPDEYTKLSYLTALASLAKRRNALYDDIPINEKRLLHFLAPLEQKRICPTFDPARMPAPPLRPRPEFDPEDMGKGKEESGGK
ncbi:MAG: hypothetical protein ACYS8W_00905 [Planctomycetota bacterium]|jgi:hypothetical protein